MNNPDAMFNELCNQNPAFKKFADENRNKTIEQIADEYGLDINLVKQLLKK